MVARTSGEYVSAILRIAAEMQESQVDQHEAICERLAILISELATWRLMGVDGIKLGREVLEQLRKHVEEHLSAAIVTPDLVMQPGWEAHVAFLRYIVRAIEARRVCLSDEG